MRTIQITAKCNDCCGIIFNDDENAIVKESHGYVPRLIGIGGGDYIRLTIDIDSGKVIGWEYPENEDILESFVHM